MQQRRKRKSLTADNSVKGDLAMARQLNDLGDRLCADHQLLEQRMVNMKSHIDGLAQEVRDQRKWFQQRLDRLDGRIWALVVMMTGTLIGTVIKLFV